MKANTTNDQIMIPVHVDISKELESDIKSLNEKIDQILSILKNKKEGDQNAI